MPSQEEFNNVWDYKNDYTPLSEKDHIKPDN